MPELTAPAATVAVTRNRPTRTADYGPAPEGHPRHGRKVAGRPARWTRQLRSGSTFLVDALELEALEAWAKAHPLLGRDLVIRRLPSRPAQVLEAPALEAPQALQEPAPQIEAPKARRRRQAEPEAEPGAGEG